MKLSKLINEIQTQKLNEGGVIHWGKKKTIPGSYKQHAYTDSVDYIIPFSGDADPKKMAAAVYSKRSPGHIIGSSYGSTSYSLISVDEKNKTIVVRAETGIGD